MLSDIKNVLGARKSEVFLHHFDSGKIRRVFFASAEGVTFLQGVTSAAVVEVAVGPCGDDGSFRLRLLLSATDGID